MSWCLAEVPETKFFIFFLLQPQQPSFNHLASGSEGSKRVLTDKAHASQQCQHRLSKINCHIYRSTAFIQFVYTHSWVNMQRIHHADRRTMQPLETCNDVAIPVSCWNSWCYIAREFCDWVWRTSQCQVIFPWEIFENSTKFLLRYCQSRTSEQFVVSPALEPQHIFISFSWCSHKGEKGLQN